MAASGPCRGVPTDACQWAPGDSFPLSACALSLAFSLLFVCLLRARGYQKSRRPRPAPRSLLATMVAVGSAEAMLPVQSSRQAKSLFSGATCERSNHLAAGLP